jgi:Sulfotransferase domain
VLYGIKYVARYFLGKDIAGRNMAVFPGDTFIASYPRSGNTWTRFLIANLMHPAKPVTFSNIEQIIPDSTALSSRAMKRVPRPRLVKSHEYFEPRYERVIYLVRDPRDVAISLYNFRRKYRTIPDSYPIDRYVSERFVKGDLDVSWGEHVGSWLGARAKHPGFLLVRYEDLQRHPANELCRIADFLGIDATTERIALAIERSEANRLRELEKVEHEKWITTKGKRTDVPFIATAETGSWKERLPGVAITLIESAWGDLMKSLSYELSA